MMVMRRPREHPSRSAPHRACSPMISAMPALRCLRPCAGAASYDVLQDFSAEASTIDIDRSVTIQGGYVAGQWTATPDPVAHPTILDAQNHGRVVTSESRYTMSTTNTIYTAPIATNV